MFRSMVAGGWCPWRWNNGTLREVLKCTWNKVCEIHVTWLQSISKLGLVEIKIIISCWPPTSSTAFCAAISSSSLNKKHESWGNDYLLQSSLQYTVMKSNCINFPAIFFGKGTIVGSKGDNDNESPKVEMYNCTTCGLINQVTNLSKVLLYSCIGNSSISAGFYKIITYFNISRNIAIFAFETAFCLLFAISFSNCPKYS